MQFISAHYLSFLNILYLFLNILFIEANLEAFVFIIITNIVEWVLLYYYKK